MAHEKAVPHVKHPVDRTLVLAVFDDEGVADTAARALRRRLSAAPSGSDLTAGMLVKRPDGSVRTAKVGPLATDSGPAVGSVLSLVGLAVVGGEPAAGGAPVANSDFFCEGSGLSEDDVSRLGAELDAGRAVLGVLAQADEASSWAIVELAELGGKTESHRVTEGALTRVAEAAGSMQ